MNRRDLNVLNTHVAAIISLLIVFVRNTVSLSETEKESLMKQRIERGCASSDEDRVEYG